MMPRGAVDRGSLASDSLKFTPLGGKAASAAVLPVDGEAFSRRTPTLPGARLAFRLRAVALEDRGILSPTLERKQHFGRVSTRTARGVAIDGSVTCCPSGNVDIRDGGFSVVEWPGYRSPDNPARPDGVNTVCLPVTLPINSAPHPQTTVTQRDGMFAEWQHSGATGRPVAASPLGPARPLAACDRMTPMRRVGVGVKGRWH